MTTAPSSPSALARASVDHPIIDGDSHIVEFTPVLMDFVREVGGSDAVDRWNAVWSGQAPMSTDERRPAGLRRQPWWVPTTETLDRATAMLPKLYHERLDELGLDYLVLYPTNGLIFNELRDEELRGIISRAYNAYIAEAYADYGDRMTVAAIIQMTTPEEGIAELEHAHALDLKVAMIPAFQRRPIPYLMDGVPQEILNRYPETWWRFTWLDSYGLDSAYDYDPFWQRCVDLGFAVAAHTNGMGLSDRSSSSAYMFNHMGHFAAAGEHLCKSLYMGGVTRRFPALRVALLEGGVANGCRLFADIIERWEKRGIDAQDHIDPAMIDRELALDLFSRYGDERTLAKLDELPAALGLDRPGMPASERDDFAAMEITREEDFRDLFIPNFFFGCEADDRMNAWAFQHNPFDAQLHAILSTDLGHWDVENMREAVAEAHEQIEKGLLTADNFRDLAFTNQVRLYGGANSDFFKGSRVEEAAQAVLVADAG